MTALKRADSFTPHTRTIGDGGDDEDGQGVEHHRHAEHVRSAVEQPGDLAGGAVVGGEPPRELHAEAVEQGDHVPRPGDGHRGVADGVLEEQVPADDPGDQLAQRGVGVRVGAARHRDHGGELGVAERGEGADDGRQDEGEDERRARAGPRRVPRGGAADGGEDARADDGADAQGDEAPGAQNLAKPGPAPIGLGHDAVDGLGAEELVHGSPTGPGRYTRKLVDRPAPDGPPPAAA